MAWRPSPRTQRRLAAVTLAWLTGWLVVGLLDGRVGQPVVAVCGLAAGLAAFTVPDRARGWALWLVALVGLPLWGYVINRGLPACDACASQVRLLHADGIGGLYLGYGLGLLGHVLHRRHSQPLPRRGEALLLGLMGVGATVALALAVHFGGLPLFGLMVPVALPLVAPYLALITFGGAIVRRLRRRAAQAGVTDAGLAYAACLGAWLVVHDLFWIAPVRTFTESCDGLLATRRAMEVADCHYLCTVAARGHGWLVRPERAGRRGGEPILVNRQLAVANAFEDLLHDRWPRFGRRARRVYDRLGLPVARFIRAPWASDAVFLLMKPAEWLFLLVLLVLDRRPEARIDRMYR